MYTDRQCPPSYLGFFANRDEAQDSAAQLLRHRLPRAALLLKESQGDLETWCPFSQRRLVGASLSIVIWGGLLGLAAIVSGWARILSRVPCIMSTMDDRTPLETILGALREMLPMLRSRYRVRDIGLFGSYVRQGERSGSDLDVLVTFEEAPSLLRFLELENLLADRLGLPVDLVMRDALKPRIGSRILRDVVPV